MRHLFHSLQRPAVLAANFSMLALLCAAGAKLTWNLLAPRPGIAQATSEAPPSESAAIVAGTHLFGGAAEGALASGLKLRGVFAAEKGQPGAAIFQAPGKSDLVVQAGAMLAPGLTLEKIASDHVVLSQNGAKFTLKIEEIAPPLSLDGKARK